jgi:hypothetical protein
VSNSSLSLELSSTTDSDAWAFAKETEPCLLL